VINRQPSGYLGRSRTAIAVILAGTQIACMGPMRQYRAAADYLTNANPSHIQVTLVDGTTRELNGARVMDDSLTGWTRNGTEFVSFPLTDVGSVGVREPSAGRTALLVGGIVSAFVAVAVLVGGIGFDTNEPDPELDPEHLPGAKTIHPGEDL
jgi:hypothetical protein